MRRRSIISAIVSAAVLGGVIWVVGIGATISIVVLVFGALMLAAGWQMSGATGRTAVMLAIWSVVTVIICWLIGVGQ